MKIERRTIGRFQSLTRMILILGTVFIAGSVMAAMGKAPVQHASGRSQSVSAQRKLPAAAQSAISAALGRDQQAYHAAAVRNGFIVKNRRSNLQATFTRQGVRVESGKASWGMALVAFGASGKLQPVAATKPQANENRVEYRHRALTEWYVNGPAGLEQGFTIARAPAGSANGTIELALRLTGNVTASVDAAKTGLILKGKKTSLRYSGLAARDANGRRLRSWLAVRKGRLLVQVAAAGATYPLVVDPYIYIQVAKLVSSDGDRLGQAVAISGNGKTVVALNGGGYGYVFTAPSWGQAAKLAPSHLSAFYDDDYEPQQVAVSSDGAVVVVGSPSAGSGKGAAYVFVRPPSGWANEGETATLVAPDGANGDALGFSVSVSSDGSTVVAGAPASIVPLKQGAAYVFDEPEGGWAGESSPQEAVAKLIPSHRTNGDSMGWSVSISANGSTVAVGTPQTNILIYCVFIGCEAPSPGAVYVFDEPGGGWAGESSPQKEAAKLVASDGADNDQLGTSVGISANGSTVVAGAPEVGAAYVYDEPSGGWSNATSPQNEAAKLMASDGVFLGSSVSVSGDGSTVAAGAPQVDSYKGAVYLFAKPMGGWGNAINPQTENYKLLASDGNNGDIMGLSTSLTADGLTVATGAMNATDQKGAVYVFSGAVPFDSFDASKLRITLGPPSSFELSSKFTLGTDTNPQTSGIFPLTEPVTLIVGNLVLPIPAGSFLPQKNGNYVFSGVVDGVSLNAKFEDQGSNMWVFKANGSSPNALNITNPVTVTLSIGNDSGTVTETVPIN